MINELHRRTEQVVPGVKGFDTWSDERVLQALLAGQFRALDAVQAALPSLVVAANEIAERLRKGGRLAYAGAGTSIRVAVQDGSELPATFGVPEERILYFIAGGRAAMFDTLADAEDDAEAGREAAQVCLPGDAVIAVAASGRTPYTIAAAREAKARGALVVSVVNNAATDLGAAADIEVVLDSGPEVISGSTRMGAGTAQKAALNVLSTLVHTKLGAVYDGLMVNVQAGNRKLVARATSIVMQIAGASEAAAGAALEQTAGEIKPAVLICYGLLPEAAKKRLADTGGNLRLALAGLAAKV